MPGARPFIRRLSLRVSWVAVIAAGCHSHSTPPPSAARSIGGGITFSAPPIALTPPPVRSEQLEPPEIDLSHFYSDSFVPPGSKIVFDAGTTLSLAPTRFARHPSQERLPDPSGGRRTLRCDGLGNDRLVTHWLTLADANGIDRAVFQTIYAFEASWSPDGAFVGITHTFAANRSDVRIVKLDDELTTLRFDAGECLAAAFDSDFGASPISARLHGWTSKGEAVIRAVSRSATAPFLQFGIEGIADVRKAENGTLRVHVLRSYIKRPPPAAQLGSGGSAP